MRGCLSSPLSPRLPGSGATYLSPMAVSAAAMGCCSVFDRACGLRCPLPPRLGMVYAPSGEHREDGSLGQPKPADRPMWTAPPIGAPAGPQKRPPFQASAIQLAVGFGGLLILLSAGLWRGAQQAPFWIESVRWDAFPGLCRVTFTARNRRPQAMNAEAAILFYTTTSNTGQEVYAALQGSLKVPVRLAGHGSRVITAEIRDVQTAADCSKVEVKPLALSGSS